MMKCYVFRVSTKVRYRIEPDEHDFKTVTHIWRCVGPANYEEVALALCRAYHNDSKELVITQELTTEIDAVIRID